MTSEFWPSSAKSWAVSNLTRNGPTWIDLAWFVHPDAGNIQYVSHDLAKDPEQGDEERVFEFTTVAQKNGQLVASALPVPVWTSRRSAVRKSTVLQATSTESPEPSYRLHNASQHRMLPFWQASKTTIRTEVTFAEFLEQPLARLQSHRVRQCGHVNCEGGSCDVCRIRRPPPATPMTSY